MNIFRADLHIHTVLSPCGDLDMSPVKIIEKAREKALDIIGITDHNSTLHCKLISELGKDAGVYVLMGAEVTTKEEIHCLAFFENNELLKSFQSYIEMHQCDIPNDVHKFGYQVVVDKDENILDEIKPLLISALDISLNDLKQEVESRCGIFIPAHIDRPSYSLTSQLGFIPTELIPDAFEISANCDVQKMIQMLKKHEQVSIIRSSDAHYLHQIGSASVELFMEHRSFNEIKAALHNEMGRKVLIG